MEIYTMTNAMTNASLPLTRSCTPSALPAPVAAPVAVPAVERASIPAASAVRPVAVPATERAPISRVHQVQAQAELAQTVLLDGINGTTGTTNGFDGITVSKRFTDGNSGVPPRGRPV